jgi:mRNA interferase RelE/StbE
VAYRLEIKRTAQRSLVRLAGAFPRDLERIEAAIDGLYLDPRPRGTAKIHGRLPVWRLRVGSYRIIYAVFDAEQLIVIGKVERRTERTYVDIEELFR